MLLTFATAVLLGLKSSEVVLAVVLATSLSRRPQKATNALALPFIAAAAAA